MDEVEDELADLPVYRGAKGSIVRLKIQDFMTYRNVEMRAGPHVNLIMGPNGTGKSTIVCAICLALAGKPKILGRAHSLREYIRHGATRATVEVELFNPESLTGTVQNWIIKRVIEDNHSGGASTEWFVNDRKCRENQIEKLMKNLNIQLDNLCQFLPQDRVQDFAKMDSIQLLKSTEQSIDNDHGGNLADKHANLIKLREEITQLQKKLKKSDENLRNEMQQNVQLENEVRMFQDRERMEKEVEGLEGRKLWLQYQIALNEFSAAKKEYEKKEAKRKKEEESLAPRQKELDTIRGRLTHHRDEMNKIKTQCLSLLDRVRRKYQDTVELTETQADRCKVELETAEKRERDRGRRLDELKERIQGYKRELEELAQAGATNYEEMNREIEKLDQQRRGVTSRIVELSAADDADKGELRLAGNQIRNLEHELKAMSDFRSSRMRYLERLNPDLAKAVRHFSDPANLEAAQFRGRIHEPLILHAYVNDLTYGKVAEQCIPKPDLVAYFCECKDDVRRMMSVVKQHGWRISCIHHEMPPNFRKPSANWYSEELIRTYDFKKNLVDLIEAPDYYMSYLCKTSKPQDMLIGTEKTAELRTEIMKNTNLQRFVTLSHHFTIRTSSYTGEKNSSVGYIPNATVFTDQINAAEREKLLSSLEAARQEYSKLQRQIEQRKPQMEDLERKKGEIDNRKREINDRMECAKRVQRRLDADERTYQNIEEEKLDLDEYRAQYRRKVLEAKKGQEQALANYNDSMNDISKKYVDILVHSRQTSVLQRLLNSKLNALEEARTTLDVLKAELRELEASRARAAEISKRRKLEAQKKTKASSAPEEIRNGLVTEEQLEAQINQLQAQLNFLPNTDDDVIREYRMRKTRIVDMEKSKAELEDTLSRFQVDMEEGKKAWLEPLRQLIERVNVNFGKFFANMQCVGEVSLDHAEDENDFAKYGVKIMVKFRASEPLVELCGWKQSGGERAITTALYILALQELTKVPFRVIDEINQGMDAKNEARFFQLLCSLARGEDTPQYFLLTPKLLPPVDYPDNVDFHIIFNGPHVEVGKHSAAMEESVRENKNVRRNATRDARRSGGETTEDETTDED